MKDLLVEVHYDRLGHTDPLGIHSPFRAGPRMHLIMIVVKRMNGSRIWDGGLSENLNNEVCGNVEWL